MKLWLVLLTALNGLLGFAGIGAAVIAPMLFDAPGSAENARLMTLFNAILLTPLVAVGGIALTWLLVWLKWERVAFLPAIMPSLWAAAVLIWMARAF